MAFLFKMPSHWTGPAVNHLTAGVLIEINMPLFKTAGPKFNLAISGHIVTINTQTTTIFWGMFNINNLCKDIHV